jgi:Outer membrane protein beta-barrel domain
MHVRTPVALAVAALVAAPFPASAQAKRATRTQTTPAASTTPGAGLSVGGFIGYESGDLAGLSLRLDGELPIQQLSPQIALSFVGSLGYTHFSQDIAFGDIKFNIFKLVPAARFTLPVNPQFDLYGDAGLGLYYYSFTTTQTLPFFGTVKDTGSGTGLMMRFAAGGFLKLNPKTKIGAEIGILPYFNKVDTTDFSIMVGAMFAL